MLASLAYSTLAAAALTAQLGQAAPVLDARASSPALIPTGTSYNGWTSLGCFQDTYDTSRQILTKYQYQPSMTFASCSAFCGAGGYQYMGMSNGQWCYCDNQINLYNGLGYATSADKCALGCAGESGVNCGSFWTNAMFQVSSKYNAAQASASAASSAAAYSSSAAAYSSNAAAYSSSAGAYSSKAAQYSASSSAAASASAYSAGVAASAAQYSASSSAAASASAYSAGVAASAAQYSASFSAAASASAYSASVAASAAAYSAGVYSASAAAYSQAVSASAAAYSASVAASAAAYSAGVYSASAAAYSVASSAAAYSSATSASAAAYSARVASAAAYSASSSAAAAAATATPAPWVQASVSCIAEGTSGRALIGASTSAPDMTYTKCLSYCASNGFAIAGLEYANECYCGNALVNGASLSVGSDSCNMACGGSSTKTCGGPSALTIFVIPSKVTGLSSTLNVPTAALPSGWSVASTSCVAEGTTGRALTGAATASADMTGAKCAAYCANLGFQFAGVEYGQECYCGSSLVNGASLNTPSNACNMGCGGDVNSICGGPGALTLYTNPSIKAPVTASTTPVSGALPAGWSAASSTCIQEVSGRALTGAVTSGASMTTATCLSFCQSQGFQYAGLEYGQECYCGNSLANGASLSVTSKQCNMACAADSSATCGGPNAIQLYTNPSLAPAAAPATVVNGFTSSGCIQEVSGRALTGLRVDFTDMTLQKCTAACANAGFKYAGIEYGQECYCGNSLVNGATTSLTSGQCVMPCPGNSAQMCGGPNAIQLLIAQ